MSTNRHNLYQYSFYIYKLSSAQQGNIFQLIFILVRKFFPWASYYKADWANSVFKYLLTNMYFIEKLNFGLKFMQDTYIHVHINNISIHNNTLHKLKKKLNTPTIILNPSATYYTNIFFLALFFSYKLDSCDFYN